MIDFTHFLDHVSRSELAPWHTHFEQALAAIAPDQHGDFDRWQAAVAALPTIDVAAVDLNIDCIRLDSATDIEPIVRDQLKQALLGLHPWRKGPFNLFGVKIDTEWRSDWKWQRLAPHIQSLRNRKVLDIGCGSGYHLWRMKGEQASMVVGVDPSLLFHLQFKAIERYVGPGPVYHLPLGIEHLPAEMRVFDTVFSMGVLYHRRSPFDHLIELRNLLRPGGELVLETLVVEGELGQVLVPDGRYARMGNVWFLPSVSTLLQWLKKVRFKNARCVDVTNTTTEEQRATEWMTFQSLADFLDPLDHTKTLEGYPAPRRAIIIAET